MDAEARADLIAHAQPDLRDIARKAWARTMSWAGRLCTPPDEKVGINCWMTLFGVSSKWSRSHACMLHGYKDSRKA